MESDDVYPLTPSMDTHSTKIYILVIISSETKERSQGLGIDISTYPRPCPYPILVIEKLQDLPKQYPIPRGHGWGKVAPFSLRSDSSRDPVVSLDSIRIERRSKYFCRRSNSKTSSSSTNPRISRDHSQKLIFPSVSRIPYPLFCSLSLSLST